MSLSKRRRQTELSFEEESLVAKQVPEDRVDEIGRFLKLFGYKPDKTIIQVHMPGHFNKVQPKAKREDSAKRYGVTTFVIVGRTHDPSLAERLIRPKKKRDESSPGYIGYLWKNKNLENKPPHELITADFTPVHFSYPQEWKNMFATKGFLLALHVPSSFAKDKNKLLRTLYRIGKDFDVRDRWTFLNELEELGYH